MTSKVQWILENLIMFKELRGLNCLQESVFRESFELKLSEPSISFFSRTKETKMIKLTEKLENDVKIKEAHACLKYKCQLIFSNQANSINSKFFFDIFCSITHDYMSNETPNIFLWNDNRKKYYLSLSAAIPDLKVDDLIIRELLNKSSSTCTYVNANLPLSTIYEFFEINYEKMIYNKENSELTNSIPIEELNRIYNSNTKYITEKRNEIEIRIQNVVLDSFINSNKRSIYIKDEFSNSIYELDKRESENLMRTKVKKYLTNLKIK